MRARRNEGHVELRAIQAARQDVASPAAADDDDPGLRAARRGAHEAGRASVDADHRAGARICAAAPAGAGSLQEGSGAGFSLPGGRHRRFSKVGILVGEAGRSGKVRAPAGKVLPPQVTGVEYLCGTAPAPIPTQICLVVCFLPALLGRRPGAGAGVFNQRCRPPWTLSVPAPSLTRATRSRCVRRCRSRSWRRPSGGRPRGSPRPRPRAERRRRRRRHRRGRRGRRGRGRSRGSSPRRPATS